MYIIFKGSTTKITKLECSKPSESRFCTKVVCGVKPINRTAAVVTAYCEFNGTRSDILAS